MTYYSIYTPPVAEEGYGITITTVRVVRDISFQLNVVGRLVKQCNTQEVSADHFDDILANYLSDCETF